MSRFLTEKHNALSPYVPGEQPKDDQYIKLNTNELPFPPSPLAQRLAREAAGTLNLYSDPDCTVLRKTAAEVWGVDPDEIMFANGSDDVLNYAFAAFCDEKHPLLFPDVTYSFYRSIAALNHVPYTEIPVDEEFRIHVEDYCSCGKNVLIANPNAPSGIALPLSEIEKILISNPDNIVMIDEAYIDFGGESAVRLIPQYPNLLVIRTFSKSFGMAGARLGAAIACKELIENLNRLRNSLNPYCINAMTMKAGIGALLDRSYFESCLKRVRAIREDAAGRLREAGFTVTPSVTNFLFVKHPSYPGKEICEDLRKKNILIRHFDTPRLKEWARISIGSEGEMQAVLETLLGLLKEKEDA